MAAKGTPWFKLYGQMSGHSKVESLAERLEIGNAQAIGHIVALWCWTVQYHPNGELPPDLSPRRIESKSMWEGKPGALYKSLVAVGLLEKSVDGYTIHNWDKYCGSYRRAQAAKRRRLPDVGLPDSSDHHVTLHDGHSDHHVTALCPKVLGERINNPLEITENKRNNISASELDALVISWGWQPIAPKSWPRVMGLVPFTSDELMWAKAETDRSASPKVRNLVPYMMSVVETLRHKTATQSSVDADKKNLHSAQKPGRESRVDEEAAEILKKFYAIGSATDNGGPGRAVPVTALPVHGLSSETAEGGGVDDGHGGTQ